MLSLFHEMRQALSHPVMPAPAGHSGLQTVTGLSTRTAAWVATWDHAQPARPAAGAGRGALPIPS